MTTATTQTTQHGQFAQETGVTGEWKRQGNRFTDRVSADGSSGWPAEPGRYRLVVSLACPWAHRSVIVRRLLGLEDAISLAVVDPIRDDRGWRFTLDEGGRDPVLGIGFLAEAYTRTDPSYSGRVTLPGLVDIPSGLVVTNDYPQLTLDLSTQWRAQHRPGAPDLYP
jgi:putative glutathione S-transferase